MKTYIKIALALVACSSLYAVTQKPTLSTPTISCGSSTQTSITVHVCGTGTYGAPAGFSVQWILASDLNPDGSWPSNAPSYCSASFSGVPSDSTYTLGVTGCTNVAISGESDQAFGTLNSHLGASLNCATDLACGTTYAIRVFAHGNGSYNRSAFSSPLICSTTPCTPPTNCSYTQGFWKTHGPDGCVEGNNTNTWPAAAIPMLLGNRSYTDTELCTILNAHPQGNGLITLAHQLIAAKLNIANGADASAISSTVSAADAAIGNLVVPPVGTDSVDPSATDALTNALDAYNNGDTGPGHCN